MKRIFTLLLLLGMLSTYGYTQRECSSMQNLNYLKKIYPEVIKNMQEIERQTQQYSRNTALRSGDEETITIPVVIHVLYNTTSENLPDSRIQTQLAVLNEDFRRLNPDQTDDWKQAADVNIQFELAKFDPQGNPTDGINRRFTSKSFFNPNNQMKFAKYGGADAWPADQYLNIWVCDLRGNKMGYAQFPGGPKSTDGVVIDYKYFGRTSANSPYGLGRTATHEVGHWLNLRHIWGDGDCNRDDYVHDTPRASYPSYGCQQGKVSCGSLDMVSNFMDYSYDRCMNLFTEGQKVRMRALFARGGSREPLLHSPALGHDHDPRNDVVQGAGCTNCEAEEEAPVSCAAPVDVNVEYTGRYLKATWNGESNSYLFEIKPSFSTKWFAFRVNRKSVTIAGISSSMNYKIRIKAICEDGEESEPTDASRLAQYGGRQATDGLSFPNPAANTLNLQWNPDFFAKEKVKKRPQLSMVNPNQINDLYAEPDLPRVQPWKVELYNLNGRKVVEQRIRSGDNRMDIPIGHLQTGLYIMTFIDGQDQILYRTKVVIASSRGG